jgi:hypothetical protein
MIIVSEAQINIVEENCTEIIVNYYDPELEVSEHKTFNENRNGTQVLLMRADSSCYFGTTLITNVFLPVSYDPNLNIT